MLHALMEIRDGRIYQQTHIYAQNYSPSLDGAHLLYFLLDVVCNDLLTLR